MKAWIDLVFSFASGLALGIVFSFFRFKSRLRFYKEFIEGRLASVGLRRSSKAPAPSQPETSSWKPVSDRHSEPSEESKTFQNK